MTFCNRNIQLTALFLIGSVAVFAQNKGKVTPGEGTLHDEEIIIEKQRQIELPPANRIFNKIPSPKANTQDKKMSYDFTERRLNQTQSKFTPNFTAFDAKQEDNLTGYDNYVRAGGGNNGRIYAETLLNATSTNDAVLGLHIKHNSSSTGPVDAKNSANNEQLIKLTGKYLANSFKLDGGIGFNRQQYYFYGYRHTANAIERGTIEQLLNKYSFNIGFDNTNKDAAIDYSIKTKLSYLKDKYEASETDWGTNFKATFVINDKFASLLNADAFVTQRTDGELDNRNLFRVKPTFQYKSSFLNITAGLNAVAETDKRKNINRTKGYPIINIDVMPIDGIHVFGGLDGDIERNTLTQYLSENRWLAPKANLRNTEKRREIYVGSKGIIGAGLNYEFKAALGQYYDFYAFNNTKADTSKFAVLYDSLKTNVTTITGALNYQSGELWRSFLKIEYFFYDPTTLEQAWHRPDISATWSNTLIFQKKLFFTTDIYFMSGLTGKNFATNKVVKLKPITDINAKVTYLLTDQLSAFVQMNNILGKNYERYLYYKQQGLNFLLGLAYSF